jgi:hypothetical protein
MAKIFGLRGRDKITVTKDTLEAAIRHSYKYCDKWGLHSNELGYQFIEIANIMIKKNSDRATPDWELEMLRSELVYQLFKEISREGDKSNGKKCFRQQFEAGEIDNCFNYFLQVCKWSLFEHIRSNIRMKETEAQFAEIFNDVFSATMRAEAEDNSLDLGSMTTLNYQGCSSWDDNY